MQQQRQIMFKVLKPEMFVITEEHLHLRYRKKDASP